MFKEIIKQLLSPDTWSVLSVFPSISDSDLEVCLFLVPPLPPHPSRLPWCRHRHLWLPARAPMPTLCTPCLFRGTWVAITPDIIRVSKTPRNEPQPVSMFEGLREETHVISLKKLTQQSHCNSWSRFCCIEIALLDFLNNPLTGTIFECIFDNCKEVL